MNLLYPFSVNAERLQATAAVTLSSGTTYLLPFHTFGLSTLSQLRLYFSSPVGSPTVGWEINPIGTDSSPGSAILSGTTGTIAAAGWQTLFSAQNATVSPNTYYYLKLWIVTGTSVQINGSGFPRARILSTPLLTWNGTTFTIAASPRHWGLLYTDGTTWYGNAWYGDSSNAEAGWGLSCQFPAAIRLVGATIHDWTSISPLVKTAVVELWNINTNTWLPTTLIESQNVPTIVGHQSASNTQISALFSQERQLQNFALTVRYSDATNMNARTTIGTDEANTVPLVVPYVRGLFLSAGNWSLYSSGYKVPIIHLWIREDTVTVGGGGPSVFIPPEIVIM